MNDIQYLVEVPKGLLTEKGMQIESKKLGLYMFTDYVRGAKGYIDEDEGTKTKFNFDKIPAHKKFKMPTAVFMLYEQEQLDLDELLVYSYCCLLVNAKKSHIIKLKMDRAAKVLGFTKTKIKKYLSSIEEKGYELLEKGEKNNEYILPIMNPEHIQQMEDSLEEMLEMRVKIENGEIPERETTPVPEYFMVNTLKLGFSHEEFVCIMQFAMHEPEHLSFDEVCQLIMDMPDDKVKFTKFDILRILKKAEDKNIVRIIKEKNKYHVEWLPGAFG